MCFPFLVGIVIGGTLSITSNEVYFEVDEEDEEFRNLDSRVLNHSIDVLHFKFSFQVRLSSNCDLD